MQGMLKILERYTSNPGDSCYKLAEELTKELNSTFVYVFDPSAPDFCPEFLASTYLTPELRFLIKPEQQKLVQKFLEGNKVSLLYKEQRCLQLSKVLSLSESSLSLSSSSNFFLLLSRF